MFISPGLFPNDPRFVGIGMIVPWAKNLTGVPALTASFVECNGQVLNDTESPLNGQTMPSLNATNRFLRGNATSGSTGGQESIIWNAETGWNGSTGHGLHTLDGQAQNVDGTYTIDNRPPFYNVVWVIRVK